MGAFIWHLRKKESSRRRLSAVGEEKDHCHGRSLGVVVLVVVVDLEVLLDDLHDQGEGDTVEARRGGLLDHLVVEVLTVLGSDGDSVILEFLLQAGDVCADLFLEGAQHIHVLAGVLIDLASHVLRVRFVRVRFWNKEPRPRVSLRLSVGGRVQRVVVVQFYLILLPKETTRSKSHFEGLILFLIQVLGSRTLETFLITLVGIILNFLSMSV